jgi:hypothetical protein
VFVKLHERMNSHSSLDLPLRERRRNASRILPLCTIIGIASLILAPVGPRLSAKDAPAELIQRRVAPKTAADDRPVTPLTARDRDDAISAGFEYLLKQQHSDGGWGQGGGWRQNAKQQGGRVEGANLEDPPDVGNTCVGLMAVVRASAIHESDAFTSAIRKAFDFVAKHVEAADDESLYVTPIRDTQLQVKIGAYVDTFLAGWALSELKGKLGDEDAEKRRSAALDKVVRKIERNQRADGSFDGNRGWAAVLSQGLCSKALNSASRSGAKVSDDALRKDQRQNLAGLDIATGNFTAPVAAAEPSSAGIDLYRETAKLGGLRERSQSNITRRAEIQQRLKASDLSDADKAEAKNQLEEIARDDRAANVAQRAITTKLADARYVAGFGNNGGEEFLSYLNLGESLRERGGAEWQNWKEKMSATICGAQNGDGSWSGHHCITGRTFCTGAALLTLLVDNRNDRTTDNRLPGNDTSIAATSAD